MIIPFHIIRPTICMLVIPLYLFLDIVSPIIIVDHNIVDHDYPILHNQYHSGMTCSNNGYNGNIMG